MNARGYAPTTEKRKALATVLRDMAALIGERHDTPVLLETGGTIIPSLDLNDEAKHLALRARNNEDDLNEIKEYLKADFERMSDHTAQQGIEELQNQINEVREQHGQIEQAIQSEMLSAEQEKERLNVIEGKLTALAQFVKTGTFE